MYHMSQVEEFRKAVIPAKPHQLRHGSLYTAEQAQKAFMALDQGKSPRQIVTELGLHPFVLDAIRFAYATLEQGIALSATELQSLKELEHIDLPSEGIKKGSELLALLLQADARLGALESERFEAVRCSSCKRKRSSYCKGCVQETIRAVSREAYDQGFSKAIEEVRKNTTGAPAAAETPVEGEPSSKKTG